MKRGLYIFRILFFQAHMYDQSRGREFTFLSNDTLVKSCNERIIKILS